MIPEDIRMNQSHCESIEINSLSKYLKNYVPACVLEAAFEKIFRHSDISVNANPRLEHMETHFNGKPNF